MADTPKIRFKWFTEAWEQRKLEDISDVRDGTHDSPTYQNEGHPFVTSKNVKGGFINYDDVQYISDEAFEEINKRSKVDVNDILMGMIGTIGNLALIRTEPDFAIKNVALIKDTQQVSYLYLYYCLQSKNVEKQLLSGMDGGTQKFFALKKIRELNILVPSEGEQLQIGGFLENLDHLITLHQYKCDEIIELKKYMLQKMFPQNGQKVPELRFVGFTEDWEQCKLGEIGSIQTCKRIFKEQTSESGEIPFYKNGTIGLKADAYISRELFEEYKNLYPYPEVGDILISAVGSIGRIAEYMGEDEYFQDSNVVWLKTDNNINKKFLKVSYQVINWLIEGSTVKHLYNDNILKSEIYMPNSQKEQEKIGIYFDTIDYLITLHQNKCDVLKEVKKFMLQNMFPQKG